jgi:hypothetical protein
MPASDEVNSRPAGLALAISAESLYLANLLFIPGLAFVILALLYFVRHKAAPPLAAAHLSQTLSASLWAGALLLIVNLVIVGLGGYRAPHTWIIVILYFTMAHATLVLLGAIGLSRALAGQCWRFPLVGRPLPADCPQNTRT